MSGIFISHAHSDAALAGALATLIETLFKGKIPPVNYSTRQELEGGIAPGDDWFRWIADQVGNSDVAIILLTTNSILKPWVLWEAGAVTGAAYTRSGPGEKHVYPLTFGISGDSVPGPLTRTQVVKATQRSDIGKLILDLFNIYQGSFSPSEARSFGTAMDTSITQYLSEIETVLPRLPITLTEAAVQEWLDRLKGLESAKRFTEVRVIEDWVDIAFGRDEDDKKLPLDVRLHRLMADIYAAAGNGNDAVRQYELARITAPRDIFILRNLGKAKLDIGDLDGCRKVIEEIEELDGLAFEKNPENDALKARWQRESGDRIGEQETLRKAYHRNPKSYYLGDILGQSLVKSSGLREAKEVYEQVYDILKETNEKNVWTAATSLSAAIVLGNEALVKESVGLIEQFSPTRDERASIRRGLSQIARNIAIDGSIREQLEASHWLDLRSI